MSGRISYTGNIVTNGLVLNLDAGKLDSYPRSGTTWRDISGNGNNGTLLNGPTFINENGGIFSFDATDDRCRFVASTFTAGAPQQGTFSLTVKMPPLDTTVQTVIFADGGTTNSLIYFFRNEFWTVNQYAWLIYYTTTTGNDAILPAYTYSPNVWHNTVMTFSSTGQYKTYINGTLRNTTNATNFVSWNRVGTNLPELRPSSAVGAGSIGSFQYYNRVLSDAEVSQNFNALRGRYGI